MAPDAFRAVVASHFLQEIPVAGARRTVPELPMVGNFSCLPIDNATKRVALILHVAIVCISAQQPAGLSRAASFSDGRQADGNARKEPAAGAAAARVHGTSAATYYPGNELASSSA